MVGIPDEGEDTFLFDLATEVYSGPSRWTPIPWALEHLEAVAAGKDSLQLRELQAALAAHAVPAERQAGALARRCEQLLEALLPQPKATEEEEPTMPPNPEGMLDLMSRLTKMYATYAGEARKSFDLLDRLCRSKAPSLHVVANAGQLNIAEQQVVADPKDLGRG